MKIFLIIPSFRGGGAERVFIDLADLLSRSNYEVTLVSLSGEGEYSNSLPEGLSVKVLGTGGVKNSFFALVKLLKNCDPDIIISALTHVNIAVVIASFMAKSKAKVIVTEHNPYSIEKRALSLPIRFALFIGCFCTYRLASKVVAVSKGVKTSLIKALHLKPETIKVIYNPINIDRVRTLAASEIYAKQDIPTLVTMGRLVRQKRHDVLLKAFARVCTQQKPMRLLIYGDGPLLSELMDLAERLHIKDNVQFLGFADNPFSAIANSDGFVLSSEFEGFGNVLVEALALGIPIVSTNCEVGPAEILDNGRYGLLSKEGSVESFANCLETLIFNHDFDKLKLQKRAEQFSPNHALENYQSLFKSMNIDG
ncbi:glycosyltransferase [Neptuniibacter sp. QD37_11]|uniref:glycosyltransferase n=1 Tax=Neptuniibacter sp. QD37_11 TaxID=3398209 RepID=UPI0039F4FF4B